MVLGKYKAIKENSIRTVFLDYIDAIEIPIIDYVAIGIQNNIEKTSASMMSRLDWQKQFKELNLASFDPLRKVSFNTNVNMFAFDDLCCLDSYGKEVMRQRKQYEMENGFVIIRRNLNHNFIMTLATGKKNFLPYKFYVDNKRVIAKIFDDLISLISPSTKKYQGKISNSYYLGDDAK